MRKPQPWYRSQTRSWYVKIDGVQHPLGPHPDGSPAPTTNKGRWHPLSGIERAFHRLMAGEGLATPLKNHTLAGLVEEFLTATATTTLPKTVAWYRGFLDDFASRYPRLKPEEIASRHVRDWTTAERKRMWGQSTCRSAITVLRRLLTWAVQNWLLKANPIDEVR